MEQILEIFMGLFETLGIDFSAVTEFFGTIIEIITGLFG